MELVSRTSEMATHVACATTSAANTYLTRDCRGRGGEEAGLVA